MHLLSSYTKLYSPSVRLRVSEWMSRLMESKGPLTKKKKAKHIVIKNSTVMTRKKEGEGRNQNCDDVGRRKNKYVPKVGDQKPKRNVIGVNGNVKGLNEKTEGKEEETKSPSDVDRRRKMQYTKERMGRVK